MAALKDEFSSELVAALGAELQQAWPQFPTETWVNTAGQKLEPLELLERVGHIARALSQCLPDSFTAAADVLGSALASSTFTGWMILPCGEFVAAEGMNDPETALDLLGALTPRFSSEAAMRPFIEAYPELTLAKLHSWTKHPDPHVRRLVSECTRPRLPWARQLKSFMADPSPAIELLDLLFDDPSPYVRLSVSNHLNDIAKDHPKIALECGTRWLRSSTHGERVVRHGLRTLIKKGDPDALALLGFDPEQAITLDSLSVEPAKITIGEAVTLSATLSAADSSLVMIDYVVHYQGVNKPRSPKVFKLTTRTIEPGVPCTITKKHRFAHVSIRQIYPGTHRIALMVNGKILGECQVEVSQPSGSESSKTGSQDRS